MNSTGLIESEIDEQINGYSSYDEIVAFTQSKFQINHNEVNQMVRFRFIKSLKETIKIYRILATIIGLLLIVLAVIYFCGEQRQKKFQQTSEAAAESSTNLRLMKIGEQAKYPAFILMACLARIAWIGFKIWKVKTGKPVGTMIVKDVYIHKFQKKTNR